MIDGVVSTPISTLFKLYHGSQCTWPCFPRVLFTRTQHNILFKPLAAFLHNQCQNNGQRSGRGMIPVAMTDTVIKKKEYRPIWGSNHWPSFLKSCILPTELHGFSIWRLTFCPVNPFPDKPWCLHVCSTSLLKTLWKKEEFLKMGNFSFSHNVFYPFGECFWYFHPIWNCRLQTVNSFSLKV